MNLKQKYNSYIYTEAIKSRIEMEGLYFIFKRLKIYIYQQDSKASIDIFLKSWVFSPNAEPAFWICELGWAGRGGGHRHWLQALLRPSG